MDATAGQESLVKKLYVCSTTKNKRQRNKIGNPTSINQTKTQLIARFQTGCLFFLETNCENYLQNLIKRYDE
ncbi:unnamed protein product [Dovyalis caffra]|uniref:Uncharacterized protein n=1 Tax=Dovyalis caffra TaxID=77055 RepID=A0AAV1RN84_9ROSI|nr:unnamed protein product [Dovyalis caffra]